MKMAIFCLYTWDSTQNSRQLKYWTSKKLRAFSGPHGSTFPNLWGPASAVRATSVKQVFIL